jgi:transcriptional regulator with XRE-family HTH domain
MKIIEIIRLARISQGMTQKELAEKAGIRQTHYNRIETGKINPGADLIDRLCDALKIELKQS